MNLSISAIIPTLCEEDEIGACIRAVQKGLPGAEIIVVDAQSSDKTREIARNLGARVLLADRPGRGGQMRQGAERASGDVLFFLHADTRISPCAGRLVEDFFHDPSHHWCKLRLTYAPTRKLYALLNLLAPLDNYFANTGDHGVMIRRSLYNEIGGMSDLPLFEDVEFFSRARKAAKLFCLDVPLHVSTRRLDKNGPRRQMMRNAWLMTRYAMGSDPQKLHKRYT